MYDSIRLLGSTECKGRGKEIATLRGAVANMTKRKSDKDVEKAAQTDVTGVLVAGTQTKRLTYASTVAATTRPGRPPGGSQQPRLPPRR